MSFMLASLNRKISVNQSLLGNTLLFDHNEKLDYQNEQLQKLG
jgi:hypothetical protein